MVVREETAPAAHLARVDADGLQRLPHHGGHRVVDRDAQLAHELEAETGVPLYDTVSTVVWKALEIAGADTSALRDWGRLFS